MKDDVGRQDAVELGGNIVLSGFRDIDPSSMIIVKKIVGNYARTFSERVHKFQQLQVSMKAVHHTEDRPKKFEVHARIRHDNQSATADVTDFNLFSTLDTVLKKAESIVLKE
jgi:hypothetical protein